MKVTLPPTRDHFAVVETVNTTVPGDERSRTDPGHGYAEHTSVSQLYHAFDDEESLIAFMEKVSDKRRFFIIEAKVREMKTTHSLE
jgi:hypothetical protein